MANDLPTPATTQEYFAAKAAGVDVETPTPITPMEKYLDAIAKGGGGSGDSYTKAETDALLDGKASLVDGKVPASELPSYVDDVVEYASVSAFPADGERGKIYIALDTNTSYRWSGSTYIAITGQSDWNQSDNTAPDYIKNKPTIPAAQVNSDWSAASGVAQILNKPTLGAAAAKGVDSAPTASSTNLVESGGVATALDGKQATLTAAQQAAADSGITSAKVTQYDKDSAALPGVVDGGAKNLLRITAASQTINGVTFTVNDDGTITANGTATARTSFLLCRTNIQPGNYVLSNDKITSEETYWLEQYVHYSSTSHPYYQTYTNGTYTHFSITQVPEYTQTYLIISSGQTVSNLVFKPMLCTAEDYAISPEFVPYCPSMAKLHAATSELVDSGAKNLIVPATPGAVEGIVFTRNADGSVTVECTNITSNKLLKVGDIDAPNVSQQYVLSGCTGGSSSTYQLGIYDGTTAIIYQNDAAVNYIGNISTYAVRLRIIATAQTPFSGTVTVKPMICTKAAWDVSQAYVSYCPSMAELYAMIQALQA